MLVTNMNSHECCVRRHHKIVPQPGTYDTYELVEIRPGRIVRVQKINAITENNSAPNRKTNDSHIIQEDPTKHYITNKKTSTEDELSSNTLESSSKPESTVKDIQTIENANSPDFGRRTPTSIAGIEMSPRSAESQRRMLTKSRSDTVIFFIHGVGGSSDIWTSQLHFFSSHGYNVVAPDLLGHGFSATPSDESNYSFTNLALDLLEIFDRYYGRMNILVGHSYGASFCTKIAKERYLKVTKLILISGGGPLPLYPESCHVFCLPSCILACIQSCLLDRFTGQAFTRNSKLSEDIKVKAFDVPTYVLRGTMQGQIWIEGNEEYHSEIVPSTLLIHGRNDTFVTLDEVDWMKETIFGSDLKIIDDVGHMVMMESPDMVNNYILEFITKGESSRRRTPRRVLSKSSCRRESKSIY
uniref:acylglycerol lipase n=1 Tax=Saccoglossus kowalevskii TaxID=10224 RepID=A0A1C9TA64_SACKO|nr:alpha/beta hydrolase domain-containing protein-like protein [Saccoglossus kowalevskii]